VAELDPSGDAKAVCVRYLSINIQEFRFGNLFDLNTFGTARRVCLGSDDEPLRSNYSNR
jgi:hypothetical protein